MYRIISIYPKHMDEERERQSNPFSCIGAVSAVAAIVVTLLSLTAFLLQHTSHLPAPRCNVQELYVPALDLTVAPPPANVSNATTNPILFFALRLRNNLNIRSISYNDIGLTFYYGRKAVASAVVPGFYQGRLRTAQRQAMVETVGVPWVQWRSHIQPRGGLPHQIFFKFFVLIKL